MSENADRTGPEPLRGPFPNRGRTTVRENPRTQQSIGQLVADTPRLLVSLAKDEVEQAKREVTEKGKRYGIGAGLLGAAAFFALTLWAVLVTAAILGLNTVLQPWASALIVGAVFLVLTAILALAGVAAIKRAGSLAPEQTIASVQRDLNALKGVGQYE